MDTSLIDMSTCRDIFEGTLKRGNDVLYIGFSSALSGSYNAGTMVAESLRDAYPERKIVTIDSLSASMGEGLLVYHVAEQRRAGKSIDEVSDWLIANRLHLCHWFTVDDLFSSKERREDICRNRLGGHSFGRQARAARR